MNIYQRINEVRKEISYVQKDKRVQEGGGYMAVTHDAVTAMLRDSLISHGIIITLSVVESKLSDTGTFTGKGTPFIRYEAKYRVEFVNIENPEDKLCIDIESHALDLGDKAPGKAMSYAKKYAVLKVFEIETGEDDEGRYEQSKKKESNKSEPMSSWDKLDEETQQWMLNEAMAVTVMLADNDISGAFQHIESLQMDDEFKTAFWSRLDSKQRSAIKAYSQIIHAKSIESLSNVWQAVPNHSKVSLETAKDARKAQLNRG
jgi:hypothetical protein